MSLYNLEISVSGGFFGDVSETSDRKIGLAAGVFAEIPTNNIFSVQPELLFIQKGGSESGDPFDDDDFFDDYDDDASIRLNYIDLPYLHGLIFLLSRILHPISLPVHQSDYC